MSRLELLDRIQKKVLWLGTYMVHHANSLRPNADGVKVGGHQASSSSIVSLLTALYFDALRPDDLVAVKAHASPAFYAIQYLRGRLTADALRELRTFGGLQAYPSRRKNAAVVDLSTGSMGLGAVQATFGALASRYVADHFGGERGARVIVIVGDAELDEGNVAEALAEEVVARLSNVLWIVDVNRQSLDRIVPDGRLRQMRAMFEAAGWRVSELRWGRKLQAVFDRRGGERLRERLQSMTNTEYQRLLRLPSGAVRKALVATDGGGIDRTLDRLLSDTSDAALAELVADVGGHDLRLLVEALDSAGQVSDRPAVIFANTIKGWGLPLAGDPLNHTMLLTQGQIDELRASLGIDEGREWDGFAPDSEEAELVRRLPPLFTPPAPRARPVEIPAELDESYPAECSSQEAFGRVLGAVSRLPAAERIVTVSADVAITTHLAGWINRKGVYYPEARRNPFSDVPQAMQWKESPAGQHIELGIAEHNLFLLLGALGLSRDLLGEPLLAIGTLYDPFVTRGLDALYHALYSGSRFVVAATPSGVTLSSEGGAHQSVITPGIGVALPGIVFWDPTFAREVEWILLDALRGLAEGREAAYLRLSTRPIDQSLALPPSPAYRDDVLRGAYRLVDARGEPSWDPETNAVSIFAAGVTVPEAVAAAGALREAGILASVFAVTSPDRLYRGLRDPRPYLEDLVGADEEGVPVVSVLDGHSHALAFIGAALGVPQQALGVDDFGQSGARADLYRHYGIDAAAIARAARVLVGAV